MVVSSILGQKRTDRLFGEAMSTIPDAITAFVDQLGIGTYPLPPKSDTLNGHVPDLSGLARDGEGIICQVQDNGTLDGGDSAFRRSPNG
jgi:hypothetical protein